MMQTITDNEGQTRANLASDSHAPRALPQCEEDEGQSGGSLPQVAGLTPGMKGADALKRAAPARREAFTVRN